MERSREELIRWIGEEYLRLKERGEIPTREEAEADGKANLRKDHPDWTEEQIQAEYNRVHQKIVEAFRWDGTVDYPDEEITF